MEEIVKDKSKIISGINKLADAVLVTMGPNGKTVMITDFQGRPYVTKDGVSVSDYKMLLKTLVIWQFLV